MEPIACATCYGSGVTLDGKDCGCGSRSFLRVDSTLVQMIQGNNDEITKLRAELAEAKKDAERFKRIIIEVRETLQFANDSPNSPICDTIWMMHRAETLFDFIDGRMEEMNEIDAAMRTTEDSSVDGETK